MGAASLLNFVILSAVLSCGNTGLYCATRVLYSLAKEGKAPASFSKVNSRGVPVAALVFTTAFGFLAFLTSFIGEGAAYNLAGQYGRKWVGFIAWMGIAISHYRFSQGLYSSG